MNRIGAASAGSEHRCSTSATSKKRLFEQIGPLVRDSIRRSRARSYSTACSARERLGSTGLGQGIAIPHGRIKGLKQALGAFVRPQQPIPFDAPDGRPVVAGIRAAGARTRHRGAPRAVVGARADVQRQGRSANRSPLAADAAECTQVFASLAAGVPMSRRRRRPAGRASSACSQDNHDRLGLTWLAGRQGGNRVLTGEAALKPTIGQVGHMNFIHPFRVQMIGAAEASYLRGLSEDALRASIERLFTTDLAAIVVANGEEIPTHLLDECNRHHIALADLAAAVAACRRRHAPLSRRACWPNRRRCTACFSTCWKWAC